VLVRFVSEHVRGRLTLFPGALVDLPADQAMVLVQDGVAVPAVREELAAESR
jgi:hypothetical protein